MSRPALPPWWTALRLALVRDLSDMFANAHQFAIFLLLPLFALLPFAVVGLSEMGATDISQEVVVVAPDTRLHPAILQALDDERLHVVVDSTAPADVDELLRSGNVQAVATLAASLDDPSPITVRPGAGALPWVEQRVEERLTRTWRDARVNERVGPAAPLAMLDAGGVPLNDVDDEDAPSVLSAEDIQTAATVLLGSLVIGLMGTMLGLTVGPELAKSKRTGFTYVLSLGTPAVVLFASELIAVGCLLLTQSTLTWTIGVVGLAIAAYVGLVVLPPLSTALALAPLLLLLALFAGMQSATLSLTFARATEEFPPEVRQRALLFVLLPATFLGRHVVDLTSPVLRPVLSALPLSGPLTLWFRFQDGDTGLLPFFALQALWAFGALFVGAWAYGLDESPQSHLRRRWRRRRATT